MGVELCVITDAPLDSLRRSELVRVGPRVGAPVEELDVITAVISDDDPPLLLRAPARLSP